MSTTPAVANDSVTRAPFLRNLLIWMLSFLAIPVAGYLGTSADTQRLQRWFAYLIFAAAAYVLFDTVLLS